MKPIEFDIYGERWRIFLVDPYNPVLTEKDNFLVGATFQYKREIYVSDSQDQILTEKTVRHEITHAVIEQMLFGKSEWNKEEIACFIEKYGGDIVAMSARIIREFHNGGL